MSRDWSPEQLDIFAFFEHGNGNGVVEARAGTGKTTTILEGVRRARGRAKWPIVCAFNKRIADELKAKVDGAAEVKTLHGIGFSIVQRYWEGVRVDDRRGIEIARDVTGIDAPDVMIGKVAKLAGLGKGLGIAPSHLDMYDALMDLAIRHDVEPDDEWIDAGWSIERIAMLAVRALEKARVREPSPRIDFDDMIYLPLANNWARPRNDLVVVDEAQDMNAAQLELAKRVCTEDGRIIVVGDSRQAIYGFRGADSEALERLRVELSASKMSLTTTYRCGKSIVELARKLVPDFRAHESNGPGEVQTLPIGIVPLVDAAEAGDFILSRKNAPLIRVCLRLIRKGKAARIEGRDIAKSLGTIVKRFKNARTIDALLERIDTWAVREIEKAKKHGADSAAAKDREAQINDQAEVLRALCDGLVHPSELLGRLETMFGDSDSERRPMVVCSSIHRSKGLEADRVFILRETLYPNRAWDRKAGKSQPDPLEEQNLEYVAVTRAKKTLVWVTSIAD